MMNLNEKDILLASLIGSKLVEQIPEVSLVETELKKQVGHFISLLPFKNEDQEEEKPASIEGRFWQANPSVIEKQFFPLLLRRAGTEDPFFALPYEPMISISGKNKIVKRTIAKASNFVGTVKESWAQDDYDITITGVLLGENERGSFQDAYPKKDFEKLRDYCISPTGLEVQCDLLQQLGINQIVIEEFSFPFSKGENVQVYNIKAVSDFSAEFLLEIKD